MDNHGGPLHTQTLYIKRRGSYFSARILADRIWVISAYSVHSAFQHSKWKLGPWVTLEHLWYLWEAGWPLWGLRVEYFHFLLFFFGITLLYFPIFSYGSLSRLHISYLNPDFQNPFSPSLRTIVSLDQERVFIFREYLKSLGSDFLNNLQVVHGAVWLFGSAIWVRPDLANTSLPWHYLLQVGLLTLFLTSAYVSTRKWRNLSGSWGWAQVPGRPVKSCSHSLEQYCSYDIICTCAVEKRLEVDLRHFFFLFRTKTVSSWFQIIVDACIWATCLVSQGYQVGILPFSLCLPLPCLSFCCNMEGRAVAYSWHLIVFKCHSFPMKLL